MIARALKCLAALIFSSPLIPKLLNVLIWQPKTIDLYMRLDMTVNHAASAVINLDP